MLVVFLIGTACGILAVQADRRIDGSLFGQAVLQEIGNRAAVELLRALGTLAGTACFLVGFLLFEWWVPFAALAVCFFAALPVSIFLARHIELAVRLMPILHLGTTGSATYLWLTWAGMV